MPRRRSIFTADLVNSAADGLAPHVTDDLRAAILAGDEPPRTLIAVISAGVISIASVVISKLGDVVTWLSDYSWFLGCGLGFVLYLVLADKYGVAAHSGVVEETVAA